MSEEEEEDEEERSGKEVEDDCSYDDGELLEAMPEPQSVHSSVSEQYAPSHLHSKSRVPLLRARPRQNQHSLEEASGQHTPFPLLDQGDTSGTDQGDSSGAFPSAVSTGQDQQQVLLETGSGVEFSGQGDSSWEEEEGEGKEEEEDRKSVV